MKLGRPYTGKEARRQQVLAIYGLEACRKSGAKCVLTNSDLQRLLEFAAKSQPLNARTREDMT